MNTNLHTELNHRPAIRQVLAESHSRHLVREDGIEVGFNWRRNKKLGGDITHCSTKSLLHRYLAVKVPRDPEET